jgi:hypothetical protein
MSIKALHRITARLRIGMKPKGHGWAARGERGPLLRHEVASCTTAHGKEAMIQS